MSQATSTKHTHAVILGAGPYGLSLAAHFHEAGIPFRIFGHPMSTWKTQMPVGMKLKSDGFASNLSAGSRQFTLAEFSAERGLPYHDTLIPVPLEDFIAYGEEFARRFVPNLEEQYITSVEREGDSFRIRTEDGEEFHAAQVIVATGVSLYQHVPEFLARLPEGLVSHTSVHRHFDRFAGSSVTVLGRGASALNAAVLLAEEGADVTLIARSRKIHIHEPTSTDRSLYQKLRKPLSPLGVGIRSWLASNMPDLFRVLPGPIRRTIVFKHLGPAGGTALQGRVDGQFNKLMGWTIQSAEALERSPDSPPRIKLLLTGPEGETREHITSHIIAGTGYRVDIGRLNFLSPSLQAAVRCEATGAPRLDRNFQSSAKGIYFIGPTGAASFGPLLRFAAGARYTATRITNHLRRSLARESHTVRQAMPLPSAPQQ